MQRHGAILVLAHDHSVVDLISAVLGDQSYVVWTTFASLPDRETRTVQPPALIVLDLALPARTLAKCGPRASSLPVRRAGVITITDPSIAAAALGRGNGECLMKPFALDDPLACAARYVHLPRSDTTIVQPRAATC